VGEMTLLDAALLTLAALIIGAAYAYLVTE
jgi:hypothetical protein